jgi:hypothetical protein
MGADLEGAVLAVGALIDANLVIGIFPGTHPRLHREIARNETEVCEVRA